MEGQNRTNQDIELKKLETAIIPVGNNCMKAVFCKKIKLSHDARKVVAVVQWKKEKNSRLVIETVKKVTGKNKNRK